MELAGQQVLILVTVLLITLGPAFVALWILTRRKRAARAARRSPITTELLRTPGHALRDQLEELRVDVAFDVASLTFVPALLLAFFYLHASTTGRMPSLVVHVIVLAAGTGFIAYQIRSLLRRSAQMDNLRLGLDAELAAGQELDQLMRQGAIVFHDFPADDFNIDHVVIAKQGVLAVETKGYTKPNSGEGKADARVEFDGQVLKFPWGATTKPLEQAERQAQWLGKWLSSAVGSPITALPVLALPGWYVELKGRGPVRVYSGKQLRRLLEVRGSQPLSELDVQRVAHQVEQRCRNVKRAYRPDDD